ncbi:hypothetical protein MNBD_ALPHA08-1577 [hydrothermal vent metagenome]|uniref:Flagellar protein FlaF n=1 Tax=hydrothermal vent metagenome TaxID=652676 RepID=A0A3B0R6T0_9ZZZZ
MYQNRYEEIVESSSKTERENEGLALDRSIEMMEKAQETGMASPEAIEAQFFINRLWMFFLEDLSSPTNALPEQIRADVISIGIWILREVEQIRQGQSADFLGVIEVSRAIREGLR